ncbi:protealysin inhibitor emfourin [Homoserinimonas sp. A447]
MRITVIRSGGFAGLSRQWSVRVEEQPDEEQWRELIDRLPWDRETAAPDEPDRYVYRVRCARRETVIPERRLDGPWRELVEKVKDAGAAEAPGSHEDDAPAG